MSFSTQAGQSPATQMNAQTYTVASQSHGKAASRIDGAFRSTSAYSSSWRNPSTTGNGSTYCPQDFLQASGQLVARATGSFTEMNSEVVSGTIEEMNTIEETNGLMRIKRPHTDPIGQVTPVGDALLPLLLCAAAYCLFERLRLKSIKN